MDDVELFLATHLYAGVWRTSVDSRIALITAIPLPEPKTFRLGFVCGSTPVTGKFRVFADGVAVEVTVSGGGGQALVYGKSIVIEERDPAEVTEMWYMHRMAPKDVKIFNPAFDVTPNELITAIITEKGIFNPANGGFES